MSDTLPTDRQGLLDLLELELLDISTTGNKGQIFRIFDALIRLQGGGTGTIDLSGVDDRTLPFNDGGTLVTSPVRVMDDGSAFIEGITRIESGTLAVGSYVSLSERGGFLGISNGLGDEFTLVDYRTPQDAPSTNPRLIEYTEAENDFVISTDITTPLTSPITFQYTPTMLSRTNSIRFQAGAAITNLRLRVTGVDRVTGASAVLKHYPSEADWLDDTGEDFSAGVMTLDFEDSELPLNTALDLTIEVRFDSGTVLGSAAGVPALTAVLQRGKFRSVLMQPEVLSGEDAVTLNSDNVNAYRNGILEFTNETGTQTLTISDDLYDVGDTLTVKHRATATDSNVSITQQGTSADIEGAATLTVANNTSVILQCTAANTWRIVASLSAPGAADENNFVNGLDLSITGNVLTVTLERQGLADLTETITLPATTVTPTPTPDLAAITRFSAVGQPQSVLAGTQLTGSLTFSYHVQHPEDIDGTLTISQNGTALVTNVSPTESTVQVTVTDQTLADNQTATFTLSGTTNEGATVSRDFVIRAHAPAESLYYGLSDSNNPAAVDVASFTTHEANINNTVISTGTTTAGQYFILLVPNNEDLDQIIDGLGNNVTDIFTRTPDVRTINSVLYTSYVIGALNAGGSEDYTLRF